MLSQRFFFKGNSKIEVLIFNSLCRYIAKKVRILYLEKGKGIVRILKKYKRGFDLKLT